MAAKPFASGHKLAAADVNDLVGVIDRSTSVVDVVSSTTETSVYSKVIAADAMSTDRMLRLTLKATYLNSTGGGVDITPRFKFGGTTHWGEAITLSSSATRRRIRWIVEIENLGATNVQEFEGVFSTSDAAAASVAGIGNTTSAYSGDVAGHLHILFGGSAALAIDTTAAQTLQLTVQHAASSANLSFRKFSAVLELL
jgi:hypothetical protein